MVLFNENVKFGAVIVEWRLEHEVLETDLLIVFRDIAQVLEKDFPSGLVLEGHVSCQDLRSVTNLIGLLESQGLETTRHEKESSEINEPKNDSKELDQKWSNLSDLQEMKLLCQTICWVNIL